MDSLNNICPISQRRYQEVPIDQVKVINSRTRDKDQFEMNVTSIDSVGLLKPIRVNDKFLDKTGFYELICGEGRLLAHKQLGRSVVLAEVVTCSRKEALLQSLVENIARTKPGSMDFARELKRLHDEGWTHKRIAAVPDLARPGGGIDPLPNSRSARRFHQQPDGQPAERFAGDADAAKVARGTG